MLETIIISVAAYIGTNLDDILLDTLYFSGLSERKDYGKAVFGKYIGVAALVCISFLAAKGFQLLSPSYIKYLGFLPLLLGLKQCYEHFFGKDDNEADVKVSSVNPCLGMVLLTFAGGADNIGVYTPLFASMAASEMLILLIVFALMVALFCTFAKKLSQLPLLQKLLLNKKHVIIPVVYVVLGLYILLDL